MVSYVVIFAVLTAATAVLAVNLIFRYLGHRRDRGRERAELYTSISRGVIRYPPQFMEMVASREVYSLWSASMQSGLGADMDRLFERVREEQKLFVPYKRRTRLSVMVNIVTAVVTALAIFVFVANLMAAAFPNSGLARFCRTIDVCPAIAAGSPALAAAPPRMPVVRATRPRPESPPLPRPRVYRPASTPVPGKEPLGTAPESPVPTSTRSASPAAIGCGSLPGQVRCLVDRVNGAGGCVPSHVWSLLQLGALPEELSRIGSSVQCVTGSLLGPHPPGTTARPPAAASQPKTVATPTATVGVTG